MKLVNLVPLKEGPKQAKALAKQYKLSQLQKMLDQRLGPDQEAASNMPDFDPNKFSNSEDFGPSANDLDAAITILQRQAAKKRGIPKDLTYGQAIGQDPLPDGTYLDKDGNKTTVARSKAAFTKSTKFDKRNESVNEDEDEYVSIFHYYDKLNKDKDKDKVGESVTDEGSCGYGPNGVPGRTPGGTKGMPADDRTKDMLKMLVQKEIAKLDEADAGQKVKNLTFGIQKAIVSLDPNTSYRDFAKSVAQVLIDDYGTHNYEPFIKELKSALDSTLG